jgi:hypothetical protein
LRESKRERQEKGKASRECFFRRAKRAEGLDFSEKEFTAEITKAAENTESKTELRGSCGGNMGHDITLVQP